MIRLVLNLRYAIPCICTYIYIYVYEQKERKRETLFCWTPRDVTIIKCARVATHTSVLKLVIKHIRERVRVATRVNS